jgi:hypothetical protein
VNGLPPLIVLLASSPLVVLAMLTFDNLVLIERGRYPAFWEADGKPATFYRGRKRFEPSVRSGFASNRCSFVWLFVTPRWMQDDEECRRLVRRLRALVALWNLVAVPLFLLTAIVSSTVPW